MPVLLRQIPDNSSTPGMIYVDSRGVGEVVASKLEDAGFTVIRVYPRGCSAQVQ